MDVKSTILVVDDEILNRKVLNKSLAFAGFDVIEAVDGRDALAKAEHSPDVILLDIMMPDMDGFETIVHLKEKESTRDIPVIFISAFNDSLTKVHGFQLGCVDFVIKPFDPQELVARVNRVLVMRRQEAEIRRYAATLEKLVEERTANVNKTRDELQRSLDNQVAFNSLLKLSTQDTPLDGLLAQSMRVLLGLPWLAGDAVGGMILVEEEGAALRVSGREGRIETERSPLGGRAFSAACGLPPDLSGGSVLRHSCPPPFASGLLDMGLERFFSFPIPSSAGIEGILCLGLGQSRRLDGLEEEFLTSVAATLAGIIARKRTEGSLTRNMERLRLTLEETVNALAATNERRDPYTAGHQRRVAELACALAEEMGLAPDRIEALKVAATLHDFGKIHVPLDILNKPGRLMDIEKALIKIHAEAAYDILKNIPFGKPIADYVLQHHERLDGSGYPAGLKDGEILLESRILGVADVVEAMTSHRPYRPGLGLDVALDEVRRNAGTLYDPEVVRACVTLFDKKGFSWKC